MDKYALFTLLWDHIVPPVDAGGAPLVTALMAKVGPWFKACALAYIVIMMLIAAWSNDSAAETKLFKALFLAGIIYTLTSSNAAYQYWIVGTIQGFINGISQAIAGAFNQGAPITADSYDAIGTRAFAVGLAVFKNLPTWSFKAIPLGLAVIVYWFLSYGAIVVMFSLALVSRVGMSFLLDWAPVFVGFYFVPYTRRWTDGWLAVLMTSAFVQVFAIGLAGLFIFVIGLILDLTSAGLGPAQAGEVDDGIVVGAILQLAGTALICCVFALLAGALVYFAIRITGGAHSALGSLAAPGWMPGAPPAPALPSLPAPSAPLSLGMPPNPALGGGPPALPPSAQAQIAQSMHRIVGPVQ
jgi:hypothetical protein